MLKCLHSNRFNFQLIAEKSQEFLGLSIDSLIALMSNDELNVKSEDFLFEAILKWINVNSDERRKVFK